MSAFFDGAGNGNRTRTTSLGSWDSTTKLYLRTNKTRLLCSRTLVHKAHSQRQNGNLPSRSKKRAGRVGTEYKLLAQAMLRTDDRAWEAGILPLNYTCELIKQGCFARGLWSAKPTLKDRTGICHRGLKRELGALELDTSYSLRQCFEPTTGLWKLGFYH